VLPLIALSPADAAFSSAIALSSADRVLADLRENILEPKPHQAQVVWAAPTAAGQANVGNASDFEERIDTAPVIAPQVDAYKQLRTLLEEAQPAAALDVFKTRTSSEGVFAAIESSVVIQARNVWKASDVTSAITAAIRPGLTASQLGISWSEKTSPSGAYFALDGELRIYVAARNDLLLIANSEALLQSLLKNNVAAPQTADPGVTYAAVFRHSLRQQQNFRNIAGRLDASAHGTSSAVPEPEGGNETTGRPPFFSGNIASLSRTFADVERESIQERDEGECVRQTVVYEWKHQ
jgi:hypothetical protein